MEITDQEFFRIVNYIKEKYGINLKEKRVLIVGRLQNYLVANGYDSYSQYMDLVEEDASGREAHNLINTVTTNHTFFMRESEHFDFLKNVVLPQIRENAYRSKDIRTWCAASSTGEEPYTLAMILNDFFEGEGWDTTMLATDISTKVLEKAVAGRYLNEQIEPLSQRWKTKYFTSVNQDESVVKDELKKQILFRKFNLMDNLPFKRKFHIVFIRNVMIYFEEETKRQLIDRIYEYTEMGGYLFIGTTEAIDKNATKFRYIRPSVYQKI